MTDPTQMKAGDPHLGALVMTDGGGRISHGNGFRREVLVGYCARSMRGGGFHPELRNQVFALGLAIRVSFHPRKPLLATNFLLDTGPPYPIV
jgi:hypothetical protein